MILPSSDAQEQDRTAEELMDYQLMNTVMSQDPTSFDVEEFWGLMSTIRTKQYFAHFKQLNRVLVLLSLTCGC